jgi:hypothetical protein
MRRRCCPYPYGRPPSQIGTVDQEESTSWVHPKGALAETGSVLAVSAAPKKSTWVGFPAKNQPGWGFPIDGGGPHGAAGRRAGGDVTGSPRATRGRTTSGARGGVGLCRGRWQLAHEELSAASAAARFGSDWDQAAVHRAWFRRTFNNIARQVAGEIVTRAITSHVTQAMTEHYSHVGRDEKLAAAGSVVRLVLGPREGDRAEVPSGGSGGGSSPDSDSPDAASNS